MSFRLTLDGQNFTPSDWKGVAFELGWVDEVFFVKGGGSLNFYGDAYDYIKSVYDSSYCGTIECDVYFCDELVHTGIIFVSEAVFDLVKCVVNVAVSDNGYIAKIKNKGEQKYYLDVGSSSNGTSITTASSVNIAMHTVTTGASIANRECYRIDEALGFLVRAMSDDTVDYTSDFFGSGGDGYNYVLVTGLELRNPGSNPAPQVGFKELWADLRALFNLRASFEVIGNTQTMRIEPYAYWRRGGESVAFKNLNNLTEQVDADKIYSTVECGSAKFRTSTDDTPNTSYEGNIAITWDQTIYNVRGACVTDNTLDLNVKHHIIDSNSIENAINGNETYDRENFIIETDGTDSLQFNTLGDGNAYYNQSINNNNVLQRWASRIHNDSFAGINNASTAFEGESSSSSVGGLPYFDIENIDVGGNYDETTTPGIYIAPVDGVYLFEVFIDMEITFDNAIAPDAITVANLWRQDALATYAEIVSTAQLLTPNPLYDPPLSGGVGVASVSEQFTFSFAVEAAAGEWFFLLGGGTVGSGSITYTFNPGCIFRGGDALVSSDSVPIIQATEGVPITINEFLAMSSTPEQKVSLNRNRGYIRSVIYRPLGLSEIETEFSR